jgi:GT2 family glycosyltransferase
MVTTATSREYTPHALKSFFETTPLRDRDAVVLINNDDPEVYNRIPLNGVRTELVNNSTPKSFAANANAMVDRALATESDLFFMNNDIIYADEWLTPLLGHDQAILSPVSNREVQYAGSAVVVSTQHVATTMVLKAPMELSQYLESPRMFQALAEAHRKTGGGYLPLLVFPFFCVKIPLPILHAVGRFDETFGRAGGEDYDYALRAWLAGFEVKLALSSYLLHFWGKSTWTVQDSSSTSPSYDTSFLQKFEAKWGSSLHRYIFLDDDSEVSADPELCSLRDANNIQAFIARLMKEPVQIKLG